MRVAEQFGTPAGMRPLSRRSLSRRSLLAGSALGAAALTGCSVTTSTDTGTRSGGSISGSKGHLTVSYPADSTGVFKAALVKFTKQTGIGVTWQIQLGDYVLFSQQMTAQLGSGDSSLDVIYGDDITTSLFGSAGLLTDLGPVTQKESIDVGDWPKTAVQDVSRWDGTLYRLPADAEFEVFAYRPDLLGRAKLAVPASWDELLAAGPKLRSTVPGTAVIGLNGKPGELINDLQAFASQAGGSVTDMTSPQMRRTVEFYGNMINKARISQPSAAQDDYGATTQGFISGRFATWWVWDGVWASAIRGTPIASKTAITSPPKGPRNGETLFGCWGWVVNAHSQRQDAAGKFLRFITSRETMIELSALGRCPGRISTWTDPTVRKNTPQVSLLRTLIAADLLKARPITPTFQAVTDAVEQNVNAYLTGQKTLPGALAAAQKRITPLLSTAGKK